MESIPWLSLNSFRNECFSLRKANKQYLLKFVLIKESCFVRRCNIMLHKSFYFQLAQMGDIFVLEFSIYLWIGGILPPPPTSTCAIGPIGEKLCPTFVAHGLLLLEHPRFYKRTNDGSIQFFIFQKTLNSLNRETRSLLHFVIRNIVNIYVFSCTKIHR